MFFRSLLSPQFPTSYRNTVGANTGATHSGSERNFKKDLMKLLSNEGMSTDQKMKIFSYLQKGSDQQIGTKLRAMMSTQPPIIRPEMADAIAKAASANGVPTSSIDKNDLFKPISSEEAEGTLGNSLNDFTNRMGVSPLSKQEQPPLSSLMRDFSRSWLSA